MRQYALHGRSGLNFGKLMFTEVKTGGPFIDATPAIRCHLSWKCDPGSVQPNWKKKMLTKRNVERQISFIDEKSY